MTKVFSNELSRSRTTKFLIAHLQHVLQLKQDSPINTLKEEEGFGRGVNC